MLELGRALHIVESSTHLDDHCTSPFCHPGAAPPLELEVERRDGEHAPPESDTVRSARLVHR